MEVIKNVFARTCKWCGKPRKILPKGILICNECDKTPGAIIPNETDATA